MAQSESDSAAELEKDRRVVIEFFTNVPFNKLMGMELLEIEPGRARISMHWRPDLCQPAGILHGGAIASLVDTTIAQSIFLTPANVQSRNQGNWIVAIDLRLKYLRPVSEGRIFCEARVVRSGHRIIHTAATVINEEGKDVALGDSIYMIVTEDQLHKKSS